MTKKKNKKNTQTTERESEKTGMKTVQQYSKDRKIATVDATLSSNENRAIAANKEELTKQLRKKCVFLLLLQRRMVLLFFIVLPLVVVAVVFFFAKKLPCQTENIQPNITETIHASHIMSIIYVYTHMIAFFLSFFKCPYVAYMTGYVHCRVIPFSF